MGKFLPKFGIDANRAANYNAVYEGARLNYETVSCVVSELRQAVLFMQNAKPVADFEYRSENAKEWDFNGKLWLGFISDKKCTPLCTPP